MEKNLDKTPSPQDPRRGGPACSLIGMWFWLAELLEHLARFPPLRWCQDGLASLVYHHGGGTAVSTLLAGAGLARLFGAALPQVLLASLAAVLLAGCLQWWWGK